MKSDSRRFAAAFALTQPGVGPLLRREAQRNGAVALKPETDGRADLIRITASRWQQLLGLRTAETLCADLGTLRRDTSARSTAAQLRPGKIEGTIRRLARDGIIRELPRMRVVVRVTDERRFTRTELRDAVGRRMTRDVVRDHSDAMELWVCQVAPTTLRVGIRAELQTARPASRVERPGSLRPSIAAAMISLLEGAPGRLLDPCAGSGTILSEAASMGWASFGGDIGNDALVVARENAVASLARLDARRLPYRSNVYDAVVTNVPFGAQHPLQGAPVAWYRKVLQEALRVATTVVVLAPDAPSFRQALGRIDIPPPSRYPIRVLGKEADIWHLHSQARERL